MGNLRLEAAIAAIDAANADDPNTITWLGLERPKELVHAELMTTWVARLDAHATEAQLLAARAHHLRRWALPRSEYPEGRSGYLRWRKDQAERQADEVADLLGRQGYEANEIDRVQQIIRKDGLRAGDPQVQTHEDALCLIFLQTQFDPLADQLGDDRTVEVVVKTLAKMSPRGRSEAMELDLSDHGRALVRTALSSGVDS